MALLVSGEARMAEPIVVSTKADSDVKTPNEVTRRALGEAESRYDLESFTSDSELFEDLEIQ